MTNYSGLVEKPETNPRGW